MGLSINAVTDLWHAGKTAVKKGRKYLTEETKDILSNHTQWGRRIRTGVHEAREAYTHKFEQIDENNGLTEQFARIKDNIWDASKKLITDNEFTSKLEDYARKRGFNNYKIAKGATTEKVMQDWIEMSGVGPTKFAQIISGSPKDMAKIEAKYPELAKAMKETRSHCSFSRSMEEAQQLINSSFPGQKLVIQKEMSAGSIGAAYIVKKPDGSTAVVKMLKKGVTKETLDAEEELTMRVLKELSSSPEEYAKNKEMFKTYYKDWKEELNFFSEYKNNKLLATGAKRYKVADITDISKDGSCILMDMAHGIQMNKLVEILKDYKANPTEFATKYAKEIEKNPWLKNPEKVIKELPSTLLKTFDEQFLFLKKGGKTLMHGDPHTGNFFVTADENGKLIPEFIDTGNCVARTSNQVKQDISFFSNYLVGNSQGIAKYFIEQCAYTGADKQAKIWELAADIEKNIFGKKQQITKFGDVQGSLMSILKKHGLSMSPENATAMKAQMQFFSAISEAGKLSGKTFDITTLMKDIPQAIWGMVKNGENPWVALKEAVKFAIHNQQRAVGTAYQFTMSDISKMTNISQKQLNEIG